MAKNIWLIMAFGLAAATPANAASAVYRCALNLDIVANYSADGRSVTLYAQGMTFDLPPAMSASGARYSNGKTIFWEHDGTARFDSSGISLTDCKAIKLH